VNIGVTFGAVGSTCEQPLRKADLARYLAKSQGKDRYEEFQDHKHAAMLAHLELEAARATKSGSISHGPLSSWPRR
jgi:predicted signal transduction protein with EAL and GGDEF domain